MLISEGKSISGCEKTAGMTTVVLRSHGSRASWVDQAIRLASRENKTFFFLVQVENVAIVHRPSSKGIHSLDPPYHPTLLAEATCPTILIRRVEAPQAHKAAPQARSKSIPLLPKDLTPPKVSQTLSRPPPSPLSQEGSRHTMMCKGQ